MKTRDRILLTARSLFNQLGYGNVTIALLAQKLSMAKGNLWYHFNDKRALLSALSEEFIALDQARRKIQPQNGAVLDSYIEFLQTLAHEIREYRFLFRDQADYGEHTEVMLKHLPIIYQEPQQQFQAFFQAMFMIS